MNSSRAVSACLGCAALFLILSGSLHGLPGSRPASRANPLPTPPRARDLSPQISSRITQISVSGSETVGTFHSVVYTRTWGTVGGTVSSGENVHGLEAVEHGADGSYRYTAEFEMVAPEKPGSNSVIVVEAENRGSPVFLNALEDTAAVGPPSSAAYPSRLGNGFLFEHATSYARVQWQYGIAAGVPIDAQGVGEVILRDFGRLLAGRTKIEAQPSFEPGVYHTLILGGISQSGFFVNTFIEEGFNADPQTGHSVFDGAIAVDGVGQWLALNQLAAEHGSQEYPYVLPNARPLAPTELLKRSSSDPFYIDIANYTDFYRLRASVTDAAERFERMRRYDWPSPHARGSGSAASGRASRCNAGGAVDLNPISYTPYLRAVLLGLEHDLGVASAKNGPALPASTLFEFVPAPSETSHFNPLPGATLAVPAIDRDDQPVGGVRFPEVSYPIGRPVPVSLSPAVTTSIGETCGNLGGWQPFTAAELARRYGSQANYVRLYSTSLDKLVAAGYLLVSDREDMLKMAAARYAHP